jgi:hypothetical protein
LSNDLQQLSIKGSSTDTLAPHSAARSDISHSAELSVVPEVPTIESSTMLGLSESTGAVENYFGEDRAAGPAGETVTPAKMPGPLAEPINVTAANVPEITETQHPSK